MLERPDLLKQLVEKHGARDATVRGTALAELEAMEVRTSQYNPGQRDPGEELAVSAGEALLVQRFRRLPRPRPQPDVGAGPAARARRRRRREGCHDLDSHRPAAEADAELKKIYETLYGMYPPEYHTDDECGRAARREPATASWRRTACCPTAMLHTFSTHATLIGPDMPLTRRQQEMISTVVSALNRCFY